MFSEGQSVFIRTVTYFYTGRVLNVDEQFVTLGEAAWIADTGRFHQAMAFGEFSEIEPYPADMRVFISKSAIVDYCEWPHALPADVK